MPHDSDRGAARQAITKGALATMAPQHIPWGTITLNLDNETFQKAFSSGRRLYAR